MTNLPTTIWLPQNGNGEFSETGVYTLVDPSGVVIVDPSHVTIVDTGSIFTQLPDTIWTVSDGTP